jgi:hypothetical protein
LLAIGFIWAKLAKALFGDDPKWAREAARIEALIAAGNIEDAIADVASLGLSF